MEFPNTTDFEQPPEKRPFNDCIDDFMKSYALLTNDAEMFMYYVTGKYINSSTIKTINEIITATTEQDRDINQTWPSNPKPEAFKKGALLALEAVSTMFPSGGWDESIAGICRQVIHDAQTLISPDNDVLESINSRSRRIQTRESMIKRAYKGRNTYTSNYAEVVTSIADTLYDDDNLKVELINGFGFIADAAMRHQKDCEQFAGRVRHTVGKNYFIDSIYRSMED